jgi:hypothetical protein
MWLVRQVRHAKLNQSLRENSVVGLEGIAKSEREIAEGERSGVTLKPVQEG